MSSVLPSFAAVQRRQRVHAAVRELLAEQGFRISMDAVAARAGCSKQTLYAQFGSKQALLRSMIDEHLDLTTVRLEADPATGSVSLRATLPNPDRKLLPGAFVTLRATLGQQNNAFLIPQGAIQRDTQGAYAMVVGQDGKVVRKLVDAGQAVGANWLITSGLAAGDQVVVDGLQKVREGAPAKPVPAGAKPAQPGAAAGQKPAAEGAKPEGKAE